MPTSTATATVTPSPSPTTTSTPTVTPTITQTPTETLSPIAEYSTFWTIERVMLWEPYVVMIIEEYEYDLDPALVLSVMAAESGGDQSVVSYAGACGLMQVIPKSWYDINPCGGPWGNMVLGMRILLGARGMAIDRDLPFEYGLAFYNCSEKGVMNDGCGSQGGLNYAEKVLTFWLPRIISRMEN